MRILLTNDDGIRAPGIAAMYQALAGLGDVFVIAPLTVQSATSHGVTFHTPLMVESETVDLPGEPTMTGLSVDGRPADCVKLAIANLWPERFGEGSRPDLVISGMNDGANVGVNVIYSGTVAAAIEAAFLGVPSIALSMTRGRAKADYAVGAAWCRAALDAVLKGGLPRPHECLSINVPPTDGSGPPVDARRVPPIRVCPMNTHGLVDKYERRVSPLGATYYWAAGHGLDFRGTDRDSDVDLLLRGCVTLTPLKFDLTREEAMSPWRARIER